MPLTAAIYTNFNWSFCLIAVVFLSLSAGDFVSRCQNSCEHDLNETNVIDRDFSCDTPCKIDTCIYGCGLWQDAIHGSCSRACNETQEFDTVSKIQHCAYGCNSAVELYVTEIKDDIGEPKAPRLQADTLTNVSLGLQWDGTSHPDVFYLVQWKYQDIPSEWAYYQGHQLLNETSIIIVDLHPYVTYLFRVIWVITSSDMLTSPPSYPITTLRSGVPSSSPTITELYSPSHSTVYIEWEQPVFINGPLTNYHLSLTEVLVENHTEIVKDVVPDTLSYTFTLLKAETFYEVKISAGNIDGRGPAAIDNVTTEAKPDVSSSTAELLYLASEELRRAVPYDHLSTLLAEIEILDRFPSTLQGLAVHYWKDLYFFSDSDGNLFRKTGNVSDGVNDTDIIFVGDDIITSISVDWLYDKVYFIANDTIVRCDLFGEDAEIVLLELDPLPGDVLVDPYSGFLYWTQVGLDHGLYRMDLADVGEVDSNSTELIITHDELSAITADYSAFRMFFANQSADTLVSVFIDGADLQTVHDNRAMTLSFEDLTGIVQFDDLFTWTIGKTQLFVEEYYPDTGQYYANDIGWHYLDFIYECNGMTVSHPTAQPYPVPSAPTSKLQALFTQSTATVTWNKPKNLDFIGKGAWRQWTYDVEIHNLETGNVTVESSGTNTSHLTVELDPSSMYGIRVRSLSPGGVGAWSKPAFVGKTLQQADIHPQILAAKENDIIQLSIDGTREDLLLSAEDEITDMDWNSDNVYWATQEGKVQFVNMSDVEHNVQTVSDISAAEAIVVDWFTGMLYWADKTQILRASVQEDGTKSISETIQAIPASDLAIDSVEAFLYLTTSSSVECSRLNGDGRFIYDELDAFTGEEVVGLTLDFDESKLRWFIHSSTGLKVFQADLAHVSLDPATTVEQTYFINSFTRQPALHYYSERLFWLNADHNIVVSTIGSDSHATMMSSTPISALSIMQPSLHPVPDKYDDIPVVTPNTIEADSIQVVGVWDNFQIQWSPSDEVTYGTVWYEYLLKYDDTQLLQILTEPYHNVTGIPPYTEMEITLEAYTYWATSESTTVSLRSPMSVPSVPLKARAFSKHDIDIYTNQLNISMDIRWEMPAVINGILLGYHVYIASEINNTISWQNVTLGSDVTQYHVENLAENSTYYISMAAYTEVGDGTTTDTIVIETEVANPPPTLLLLGSQGIEAKDLDNGDSMTLIDSGNPLFVGYISHESLLYWVDGQSGKIRQSSTGEDIEVVVPASIPVGFAVNWIGRDLYWTENSNGKGYIQRYDLNTQHQIQILSTFNDVSQIVIDPYQSRLFWTEEVENNIEIMTSDLQGKDSHPLFSPSARKRRDTPSDCNCSSNMTVSQVIAIDQSDAGNPMLYFADANEGHLWRSDTAACHCQVLFDANSVEKAGLPPDSLTVDHQSVFWTNNLEGVLNSIDKEDGSNFQTQSINDVNSVIAYGDNLQPMPGIECLAPGPYHETIENPSSTSDSLTLNLQPVTWPPQCSGISTAPVTYTVHYGILAEDIGLVQTCNKNFTCQEVSSFNETVVLEDLEPYTWYLIQASLSNFYTQGSSPLSDVVNFRTDPGVPSAVEGVNVNIRTSYVANITWLPPSEPNGPLDEIQYRVVYRTDDLPASAWFDIDEDISIFGVTIDGFFLYLTNLLPGKTYYFKVRAYPGESEEFSESEEVRNTTFLEPDDVLLVEETNTTLNVSWTAPYDNSVLRHSFKYQEPGETIWKTQTIPDAEKAGNNTYYNMIGENVPLRPNTAYKVRVDVVYITHNIYEWPPNKIFPEFTTLPGVPDIPGKPYFEEIQSQEEISIWQVKWNEPNDNGDEIYQYDLQYSRVMAKYNWSSDGNWTTVYNESKNEWSVSGLDSGVSYIFRVCAINDIGSSNYSQHSHIFNVTKPVPPKEDNIDLIIIIAVTAAVGLALIVVIIVCCCITIRRNNKAPKTGEGTVHFDVDRELATLRTLPNSLVRESNVLYGVGNLPPGDIDLPLFPREKLKLVTFLGSGAFGEVYEGVAMDIVGDNAGETKVAVKTLRKGATDQEKEEFLKEAQLMSNFKHPHILQLLGVCLDNDPQFIILELMEAGDLLSYLRSCRPTAASPATLGCLDLIEISIDVCKGCTYLEEMHFVHRDLAARNCLVSHRDPRFRSVKIGDFGLARDIYKNDYYRKEGEGLLPVRWMSPESLVDGVFTIQSDLWSFGVLLWEIMTLGQQPYPARTNVEVLHFVTTGGRLSRPDNCPDDVHQLMLKCWHNDPEGRPTFRYLLQKLETYKRKSLTMDGIDNMAFDGPVNYSKIRQQAETSVEDEEGYLEPVDSKQSLKSRGSYRTELLSESSGIGSGSSLKPPTPKPSPLLGKKFAGASGHDTSQGSPRLDGRRSGKFSALENPAFDRERSTHNPRYAMDVSVTPRSTPLATPRSTPTSSRKVLYHDNKAFLPDDDDILENSKDSMKSSLSKATGKNLVGRKDSGSKPSSFSKATGASLFGGKGVGRQSSLTKSSTPNTNSQPNSVSKATGRGMQPSSLSKATGKNAQPNSLSKATAASAADTSSQHGSVSKGTGAGFTANNVSNPSSKRHPNPFRKDNQAEESKESGASGGARPYENVGKGGSTRRKDKDPKYENVNSKKSNPPKEQIVARI